MYAHRNMGTERLNLIGTSQTSFLLLLSLAAQIEL